MLTECYWAVLCEDDHPKDSMEHDETWLGPFGAYAEAEASVRMHLQASTPERGYASGHVCKRLTVVA